MKVLVTGAKGQLGYDIVERLKELNIEHIGVDREDFDLTNEKETKDYILNYKPDVVIHCAAYTAVDKAEDEREICYAVNVLGTKYVVEACKELNAKMVYISTDYVFDGEKEEPYEVDDKPNPINYYGYTKYLGEEEVKNNLEKYFIVRISWVFGRNGNNFVKTMLRLGQEKKEISVVSDQIGSPTYTYDLAKLLCDMIKTNKYGIYHATNEGYCSWYEFACEIFKVAGMDVKVIPIKSEEYPTRARRPRNSRLNKQKTVKYFDILPYWIESIKSFLDLYDVNNKKVSDIYILHEYMAVEHFEALIKEVNKFGYNIKDYIVLSDKYLIKQIIKDVIKFKSPIKNVKLFFKNRRKRLQLKYLKNKILIVGIAPYDKLLFKYKNVFKNNYSIYFTSWQYWDGSKFVHGKKIYKERFEDILKRYFVACAAVTEKTKEELRTIFKNIVVVNHSIETEKYTKKKELNKKKKFIFLGQLIERKNINFIIRFINDSKNIDYEFYFAGEGNLKKKILNLMKKDKRVFYLGKLNKKQIEKNLSQYDYLVLPSKEEPFGIVIIEALSSGIPCIVSNALGPREIIKDRINGFVFDKNDYNSFKVKMEQAIECNCNNYLFLSKNALETAKNYDTKNIIKKWIELFEVIK